MAKKRKKRSVRADTSTTSSTSAFTIWLSSDGDIEVPGYSKLSHCPEVCAAIDRIALLISSMTIYLMANTDKGDVRVGNELAKKLDIYPNKFMTRQAWMADIVRTLLGDGDGNVVCVPKTDNGYIGDIVKLAPGTFSLEQDGYGYKINISGTYYDPSEFLHFTFNQDTSYPWKGRGFKVSLASLADNLQQAAATEKAFMSSKWKPSLIVKADANNAEFSSPEGRKKLREDYLEGSEAGEPWIIPYDSFEVQQIKPLSLNDLAINDNIQLDRKMVASIIGIPPFLLGVGDFNQQEYNNFISRTVLPIAKEIEQELTRKLIISPKMYLKFNIKSLYQYDIQTLSNIYDDNYKMGVVTGNEVRDVLSLTPMDGLDELVMLENYIPAGMIGDQKKLVQNDQKKGSTK